MSHPERVTPRAQLLDKVWGDHVFIEERTVDVHVKRLREGAGAGRSEATGGDGARRRLPHLHPAGTVIQRVAIRTKCEASRRTSSVAVRTRLVECVNA